MRAVVFHGVGDIRVEEVDEPTIQEPTDAIVRITASAICGTDLHMIRGSLPGMEPGTILGHEGVGVVEEVGDQVHNLRPGDRVVIPSTIGCGYCSYCRAGYFAQCDHANPNGPQAGTAFFGGPKSTGPFAGLQAEYARIPYANVGPIRIPDNVIDEQAILLSDIFPTGYFGADLAEIKDGDIVAVFGCGPVGQFAILSAFLMGAGRVLAVDRIESRLDMARGLGAEVVNFEQEHPVEALRELTGGIGPDRVIDAVGVDAEAPERGPAAGEAEQERERFEREIEALAPERSRGDGEWQPGSAPSQAIEWAVQAVAKAGTVSIIGVYPPGMQHFPLGQAMNRNLTVNMGNCNHRRYMPRLMDMVATGQVDPTKVLTQEEPIEAGVEAFRAFNERQSGWVKVELQPAH